MGSEPTKLGSEGLTIYFISISTLVFIVGGSVCLPVYRLVREIEIEREREKERERDLF